MADAHVFWESSNDSRVRVDNGGKVRAIGTGVATITATAGSAEGTAQISVTNPDRAALIALYRATGGPNCSRNANWLTDGHVQEWEEVLTRFGRVARLDLWDNGLTGSLSPELGKLNKLINLRLLDNNLTGPIPAELGNLANLWNLSAARNNLSGAIPPELGNLANLEELYLCGNNLTGPIPESSLQLDRLRILAIQPNDGLYGPETPAVTAWLRGITASGCG